MKEGCTRCHPPFRGEKPAEPPAIANFVPHSDYPNPPLDFSRMAGSP